MSEPKSQEGDSAERKKLLLESTRYWWLPHIVIAFVSGIAAFWSTFVQRIVPEPYLDEVFHVRQAQAYCEGRFGQWDPKITTPPGLYLIPLPFKWLGLNDCTVAALRSENPFILGALAFTIFSFLARRSWFRSGRSVIPLTDLLNNAHAAANIVLFPPLFFFSALFYTDLASTFAVVLFLDDLQANPPDGIRFSFTQLFFAFAALLFRQTNIFWVAVFPAVLDVITVLKKKVDGAAHSGDREVIHDPPIEDATIEDCLRAPLSLANAAIKNARLLLQVVPQHIFVLASFAAFVLLNGGVVLGDKSNHVATLHLPQMLYIWPYITFFSFPLILPYALSTLRLAVDHGIRAARLPRLWVLLSLTAAAALAIRFNTIVHPFTLADNRHYTFYVFRLLLRSPQLKYGAAPVYVLTGWLCIRRLGAHPADRDMDEDSHSAAAKSAGSASSIRNTDTINLSFTLAWLLASTLNLVTAPLVEPRYFIIPWLVWRLHLPPTSGGSDDPAAPSVNRITGQANGSLATALKRHDGTLWLETLWAVAVNVAVGRMFLYNGFEWAQEPGKVQRFMW